MSTITGGGFNLQFTLGSNDASAATTSINNAITALLTSGGLVVAPNAATNPASGKGFAVISSAGTASTLGSSVTAVAVTAANTAGTTISGVGTAGELVVYGNTAVTYNTGGGTGSVSGGDVGSLLGTPTSGGGAFAFTTGSGNDTILAVTGNNTVAAGTGNNVIFTGQSSDNVNSTGNDIISGVGGLAGQSDTINGGAGTDLVFEGAKNFTFNGGSGASTVISGTGSDTISIGSGGGIYGGGTAGNNKITTGLTGNSTIFGGGSGDVLTAVGSGNNLLAAGSGNETLTGATSTGNNIFFGGTGSTSIQGGPGNDVIVVGQGSSTVDGGAGADLIGVVSGRAGGTVLVNGFRPGVDGDRFTLQGYSASTLASALSGIQAVTVNGLASQQISLTDGTKITFAGVTNLSANNFI